MKVLSKMVILAAACVAPLTAAAPAAAPRDITLAVVNGERVLDSDLLALFSSRHSGHAKFLGGEAEARTFLKIVIEDRLLVQEARALGIDRQDAVMAAVEELENTRSRDALLKLELDEKAKPGAAEIQAAYEQMRRVYQVRQILVGTRTEAQEIHAALMSGADFQTLARTCSLARSASRGGVMMTMWGKSSEEWETVVFAMEPGEISSVIETPDGFEVVRLENYADVEPQPIEKAQPEIQNVLSKRKLAHRREQFSEELWSKHKGAVVLSPLDPTAMLSAGPDTVVATWEGGGKLLVREVATAEELNAWAALPVSAWRKEVDSRVRRTVNDALAIREAGARKLHETPAVATEVATYRDYISEAILFRDHIFRELSVTDDEIRRYFDEHRTEFIEPEQRRVAQIMLTSRAEADTVTKDLAAGATFEDLAKKYSRDFATARTGGDLGWVAASSVPPAFKAVWSLAAGSVGEPVQHENKWHIIKVLEVRPPRQLEWTEAADRVRERLLEVKKTAARKHWIEKLTEIATVKIDDAAIKRFVSQNEMDSGDAPAPQHAVPAAPVQGGHGKPPVR